MHFIINSVEMYTTLLTLYILQKLVYISHNYTYSSLTMRIRDTHTHAPSSLLGISTNIDMVRWTRSHGAKFNKISTYYFLYLFS